MFPRITTDLIKIKSNVERIVGLCHDAGLICAIVTKCVCAVQEIVDIVNESDADIVADSRIINLKRMKTDKPRMLLRISQPHEVADVVAYTDISQQSEIETISLLGAEAKKQNRRHKVILMVDMGDLREGVFFKNRGDILALANAVKEYENLELYGIGVNLTCYGGIMPDETNLGGLVEIAEWLRKETGLPIPLVSGGNSSSLPMLLEGKLPKGITNLRMGECWLLGKETLFGNHVEGLNGDCFRLEAQLVELKKKPSMPVGQTGINAFGEHIQYVDKGEMLRGICAIGRQDAVVDGLIPYDTRVEVIGASSDHLIVNLTDAANEYKVGDAVAFNVSYGALLAAFTSEYVKKEYK